MLVACDGSSHKKPDGTIGGPIGWGFAAEDGFWLSNGLPEGTNQRAELLGLLSVLITYPKTPLHLQMDSQYALNTASKWIYGWAKNDWIKGDQKPIKNLDIIKPLYTVLTKRTDAVIYQWVKGHLKSNAFPLNTVADVRAGEASARAKLITDFTNFDVYQDSQGNVENKNQKYLVDKIFHNK